MSGEPTDLVNTHHLEALQVITPREYPDIANRTSEYHAWRQGYLEDASRLMTLLLYTLHFPCSWLLYGLWLCMVHITIYPPWVYQSTHPSSGSSSGFPGGLLTGRSHPFCNTLYALWCISTTFCAHIFCLVYPCHTHHIGRGLVISPKDYSTKYRY